MSNTSIEERKVTDKPIKDSYKGILRIAPFFDISDIKDDNYKNENLYCYDECNVLSSYKSQVSAYPALIGNTVRYNFPDDELKHCKLPVTDSVGNYLNWNVGLNGVTIGSQYSHDNEYEIFNTNNMCVGLEKNKSKKSNQSENGGTVIINSSLKIGDTTISPSRNIKNGDSIIRNFDGIADYENIDEIIDDFIKKIYKNGFIKEVPSGSVIYHAASLEDWRTKNINDDDDIALQQGTNEILIQGTPRINKNDIVKYKRDYLLCDGSIYKMIYVPKNFSIKGDICENREKFFELFFTIGYAYTERQNIAKRLQSIYDKKSHRYVPILNDSKTQIFKPLEWDNLKNTDFTKLRQYNFSPFVMDGEVKKSPVKLPITDIKYNNLDDVDVLFQEDLATMLCCDEIYNYVRNYQKTNNGKLPSDFEINNTLEGKSIPDEYIFNSFIRDSKGQAKWSLPDGVADKSIEDVIELSFADENDKITVLLGKEINNFGQNIKYYSPSEETYKQCKIWRLPLITLFKRLLLSGLSDEDLLPYFHYFYSFNFQVPKLVSDDYTPTFIGSGAYMLAKNNSKNTNKVKSWSGTSNTYKIIPHRHFISLSKQDENGKFISFNDISSGTYPFSNSLNDYKLKPLNEDNILVSEYCDYRIDSQLPDVYNDSYILGDFESSLSSKTIYYNSTESFVANEEPDRGLTSEAIFTTESLGNYKNDANKTNFPNSTSKYFFSMKNITYLPLIKI